MKFLSPLLLVATATIAPVTVADTGKTEPMSIIDLAAADGKYDTLLSAVTNTPGVLDTITSNFPVTIFGPTDDAFAAISDTVAGLDEATLAGVLAGHVVAGVFTAQMVIDAGCVELETLAGNQVRVWYTNGKVMVNEATVIQPDIIGTGGVIHGIDTVILPGTFMPCPSSSGGSGTGKGSKKMSGKGGKGGSSKGMTSGKGGSKGASSGKAGSKGMSSGKAGSKGMSSKKAGKGGSSKGGSTVSSPISASVDAPAPVAPTVVSSPVAPVPAPVAPVPAPVAPVPAPISPPTTVVVQPVGPPPTPAPVPAPVAPPTSAPVPPPTPRPVAPTPAQPVIQPVSAPTGGLMVLPPTFS